MDSSGYELGVNLLTVFLFISVAFDTEASET